MCSPQAMQTVAAAMTRRGVLGAGLAGAAAAATASIPGVARADRRAVRFDQIVDLTHVAFPTFPNFFGLTMEITPILTVEDDGVFVNRINLPEHFGTHWDAPAHFVANAPTAEQIQAERLIAPLAVIDISQRAARDPDAVVAPDDILRWERRHGRLPRGSFLAMYSGWEARLPGDGFLNDVGGTFHFPGWGPEAAQFLLEERDFVGLGVDTHGIDPGHDATFPVHIATFSEGKHGVENIANLATIHPARMTVIIGAPKHQGGSGGPARLFAVA
jgi:kynurenine formamidase